MGMNVEYLRVYQIQCDGPGVDGDLFCQARAEHSPTPKGATANAQRAGFQSNEPDHPEPFWYCKDCAKTEID